MLYCIFPWLRPAPAFRPGQLVAVKSAAVDGAFPCYLFVTHRRWEATASGTKEWVYDGPMIHFAGSMLWPHGYWRGLREEDLLARALF
jgi:hypothetical protein